MIASVSSGTSVLKSSTSKVILSDANTEASNMIINKEATVAGGTGRLMFGTWERMARLRQPRVNLTGVTTDRLPLHEAEEGFQRVMKGQSGEVLFAVNRSHPFLRGFLGLSEHRSLAFLSRGVFNRDERLYHRKLLSSCRQCLPLGSLGYWNNTSE